MAALDTTRRESVTGRAGAYDCELPQLLIDELFDRGRRASGNVRSGSDWLIALFSGSGVAAETEETVLQSDEVAREAISFASQPVVIQVTDEQAEQLLRFHGRGSL